VSLPSNDFDGCQAFWEKLGFVAAGEEARPYENRALTSDHIDVAFHRPAGLARPMLVFHTRDLGQRLSSLRAAGIAPGRGPGLACAACATLEAPEGTVILLLEEEP
jgi:hypothetical protein